MLKDLYVIIAFLVIVWLISLRKRRKRILKITGLLVLGYLFLFCFPEIFQISFPNFAPKLITYLQLEETRKELDKTKRAQGKYPEKIAKTDAWGHDVVYQSAGDKFVIISAGEDGKFGTNDDIKVGSLTFRGEFYEKPRKILPKISLVKKTAKVQPPEIMFDLNCPSNLYLAAIRYYQKNPFATVMVRTKSGELKDVKISLAFGANYFQEFISSIPVIAADTPQSVYFHLYHKEGLFSVNRETGSLLTLNISYSFDGVNYSTGTTRKVTIYPKNMIDWSNPEMIACFISPSPLLSQAILNNFLNTLLTPTKKAAIFYYTLKAAKFKYNPQVKEEMNSLAEIVSAKEGNCSELSTLYLSLLSGSDVSTAAIISKDHVWCAFGISAGKGYDIAQGLIDAGTRWIGDKIVNWIFPPKPEPNFVISNCRLDRNGKKWLPVDISAVGDKNKLFTNSITDGLTLYSRPDIDITWVDIPAAREKGYLPVSSEELKFSIPGRREIENISGGELQKFLSLSL